MNNLDNFRQFNPFVPNAPFLYPLKTSVVLRVHEIYIFLHIDFFLNLMAHNQAK